MSRHRDVQAFLNKKRQAHSEWASSLARVVNAFIPLVEAELGCFGVVRMRDEKITGNGLFCKLGYAYGNGLEVQVEFSVTQTAESKFLVEWGSTPSEPNGAAANFVAHRLAYEAYKDVEYRYPVSYGQ